MITDCLFSHIIIVIYSFLFSFFGEDNLVMTFDNITAVVYATDWKVYLNKAKKRAGLILYLTYIKLSIIKYTQV